MNTSELGLVEPQRLSLSKIKDELLELENETADQVDMAYMLAIALNAPENSFSPEQRQHCEELFATIESEVTQKLKGIISEKSALTTVRMKELTEAMHQRNGILRTILSVPVPDFQGVKKPEC